MGAASGADRRSGRTDGADARNRRGADLAARVEAGAELRVLWRLQKLDQVAGIVTDEDVRPAVLKVLHPHHVRTAPAQLRGERLDIGDGEGDVLVAVGAYVRIRLAPLGRQWFGAGGLKQLDVHCTVLQDRDIGRYRFDPKTAHRHEAEHTAIPIHRGLEIRHTDPDVVMPEIERAHRSATL